MVGIVHGDIKPENLRIQPDGRVRLLDFGIAKHLTTARKFTANLFGSLPYIPPERIKQGVVNRASDLWGVGVILYLMVTGQYPFPGQGSEEIEARILSGRPPEPLPETVSPALASIILKALALDPALRYPSAAALAVALEACSGDNWDFPTRLRRVEELLGSQLPVTKHADPQVSPPTPRPHPAEGPFRFRPRTWLRISLPHQFDELPTRLAAEIGIGVGLIAALLLAKIASPTLMAAGFLLMLGAAAGLAWSGGPVLIEEPVQQDAPEDEDEEHEPSWSDFEDYTITRRLSPPAYARINYVDQGEEKVFWMNLDEITIGRRNPDTLLDLAVDASNAVSRLHVRILRVPETGEFLIINHSFLGTTVDGALLPPPDERTPLPRTGSPLGDRAVIGLAGEVFLNFQKLDRP